MLSCVRITEPQLCLREHASIGHLTGSRDGDVVGVRTAAKTRSHQHQANLARDVIRRGRRRRAEGRPRFPVSCPPTRPFPPLQPHPTCDWLSWTRMAIEFDGCNSRWTKILQIRRARRRYVILNRLAPCRVAFAAVANGLAPAAGDRDGYARQTGAVRPAVSAPARHRAQAGRRATGTRRRHALLPIVSSSGTRGCCCLPPASMAKRFASRACRSA